MEKEHEEAQSELSEEGGSDTEDAEQESEYDTESESEEEAVNLDDNEDEMTFLRAVTNRSGRIFKITSKFFSKFGPVVWKVNKTGEGQMTLTLSNIRQYRHNYHQFIFSCVGGSKSRTSTPVAF